MAAALTRKFAEGRRLAEVIRLTEQALRQLNPRSGSATIAEIESGLQFRIRQSGQMGLPGRYPSARRETACDRRTIGGHTVGSKGALGYALETNGPLMLPVHQDVGSPTSPGKRHVDAD